MSSAPTPRESLDAFRSQLDELVGELSALVRLESPSLDRERVGAFAVHYAERLRAAGMPCRLVPGPYGPHVFGELPAAETPKAGRAADRAGPPLPPLVLVGHSDTVWPLGTLEARPLERRGERLHGPGVYDMKAGLLLILAVVRHLRDRGVVLHRSLQVFVAADEEKGGLSGHPAMDELLARDATALVVEPPCADGSLKIERNGVGIYQIVVRGREAHAGVDPERGISAVHEAARLVTEIESWTEPAAGLRLNVGRFQGGSTSNVVAGEARLDIDVRYPTPELGVEIDARLRSLAPRHPDASIEVSGGLYFPPLVPTIASRRLGGIACEVARELGAEVSLGRSGGGSDGSYLASRGLTVLDGLGVDGAGAHAIDEHIEIDRIPLRAAILAHTILRIDAESSNREAPEE